MPADLLDREEISNNSRSVSYLHIKAAIHIVINRTLLTNFKTNSKNKLSRIKQIPSAKKFKFKANLSLLLMTFSEKNTITRERFQQINQIKTIAFRGSY